MSNQTKTKRKLTRTSVMLETEMLDLFRQEAVLMNADDPVGPQWDVSKMIRSAMRTAAKEWKWTPKREETEKPNE